MDLSNCITIGLEEYGAEGEIVMAPPSLRRLAWLKNKAAKCTKTTVRGPQKEISDADLGTLETLNALAHVKSAPFTIEVEPFYDFCDKLDESRPGAGVELFNKMNEAVKEINGGKVSPLA